MERITGAIYLDETQQRQVNAGQGGGPEPIMILSTALSTGLSTCLSTGLFTAMAPSGSDTVSTCDGDTSSDTTSTGD